ncbi:MAG: guanylate kinase [Syntrophobacterales bacterium]|nr:guanylate kinase [Syntrophobacterales bacterium]
MIRNLGTLFIISAPSGTGKTTLLREIRLKVPKIRFSVSFTTRKPREGEEDGRDYFFISREEFLKGIREDRFAEWAYVHDNYYGTDGYMIDNWLSEGFDVLLDIDVQGARTIKCRYPFAVTIFILPPSWEELERRLRLRGTDPEDGIKKRLINAKREIAEALWYDYLIVNEEISQAVSEITTIIMSFRYRTKNRLNFIRPLIEPEILGA